MSTLTDIIRQAQRNVAEIRPEVGGFPVLAEVLHQAGVRRNEWTLPAGQSVYVTDRGAVSGRRSHSWPSSATCPHSIATR